MAAPTILLAIGFAAVFIQYMFNTARAAKLDEWQAVLEEWAREMRGGSDIEARVSRLEMGWDGLAAHIKAAGATGVMRKVFCDGVKVGQSYGSDGPSSADIDLELIETLSEINGDYDAARDEYDDRGA